MALFQRPDGSEVVAGDGQSRRPRITRRQAMHRRNALWLRAIEVGIDEPGQGDVQPLTVREVAGLWGLDAGTVRHGIAQARQLRDQVEAFRGEA